MHRLPETVVLVCASVLTWTLFLTACGPSTETPEGATEAATDGDDASADAPRPSGLLTHEEGTAAGYVLYSPLPSGTTYLLDTEGRAVHTWESDYAPHSLYLLPNGNLLRPGRDPARQKFTAGGSMGLLQMFDWDGNLIWDWKISDDSRILHHDIEPLPNGNLLAIGWEEKTPEEARAAGRRPELIPEKGLWSEFVVEIEPLPPDDGRIVWSWHVWDHLIQNHDPDAANYGDPAEHPERVDINGGGPELEIDAEQLEQLRALGYVPTPDEDAEEEDELRPDWLHLNAIDWHPELNQIAMTAPEPGEIWILARPSSTEEAAGPAGDLLYRWGNPSTYGHGTAEEKRLFYPHDVQWVPSDAPGEGHLTVFNNGSGRPSGEWTSLEELVPPLESDGTYRRPAGEAWGPKELVWSYRAPDPESFYAPFISGAHRLPNGNTFVTHGPDGRMFEVTADGETVWEFWNPYSGNVQDSDGTRAGSDRVRYGVWRAEKLSPDYPAFSGRELVPLDPQPVVVTPTDDEEQD